MTYSPFKKIIENESTYLQVGFQHASNIVQDENLLAWEFFDKTKQHKQWIAQPVRQKLWLNVDKIGHLIKIHVTNFCR